MNSYACIIQEELHYHRAHNHNTYKAPLMALWSYIDFVRETLVIVNAAVKGPKYFYFWPAHFLKEMYIL